MNPAKVLLIALLAGTLSIGIALFGQHWFDRPEGTPATSGTGVYRGEGEMATLPDIRLPDLDGREVVSNAWAGKVVVLNYWASWCPACLREMPLLVQAQEAIGEGRLQVVGIAIDEPSEARRFVAANPLNYPVLLGGVETVELSRRLGNRTGGLPFTVIFDAHGRRVFSRTGEMTAAQLHDALRSLLPELIP